MTQTAGLYIHIPFCERKCGYCDFYSITHLELVDAFVDALIQEIQLRGRWGADYRFQTVFLGGGTPSLLSPEQLQRILGGLREHFPILRDAEITIEANPGTLSREKLRAYRQLGINRLSLGAQSLHAAELRFLGRRHTAEEVMHNVSLAREAGFENINLDLMTAFPGQTLDSFRHTLEQAVQLHPAHLSCYTLIFEPGTPFYHRMQTGELLPVPEEKEVQFYQEARRFLEERGYRQYEISNFARDKAYICRHNCIYWNYHPYLGLGPSAHSFDGKQRWANIRSVSSYIQHLKAGRLPVDFQESLTPQQQMFEYIYLHLRLRNGLDLAAFRQRFGVDLTSRYRDTIHRLLSEGLIEPPNGHLKLTDKGWLLADTIATHF